MKTATLLSVFLSFILTGCLSSSSRPKPPAGDAHTLGPAAALDVPTPAELAALRSRGPAGLKELLDKNEACLDYMRLGSTDRDRERAASLRPAIDAVAMQRDAFMSRLYWYTDLEAAKAEAKRTGRHILSLRLLGKLNEEYSCANSRFFRIVLYANPEVSDYLREHYILHWKSVRPAPLVTIDMGDRCRLKRTITGNSIHYVLDSDGTVLDALPGLYGPASFLAALARSENILTGDAATMAQWHGRQADALYRQWLGAAVDCGLYGQEFSSRMARGLDSDVEACLAEAFPSRHVRSLSTTQRSAELGTPPMLFGGLPVAKMMVEQPITQRIMPGSAPVSAAPPPVAPTTHPSDLDKRPLAERMSKEAWNKLAMLRRSEARLHMASIMLMMKKADPGAKKPETRDSSTEKLFADSAAFDRTVRNFEDAIAQDTVHNEYIFHTQIHQWLEQDATGALSHDVEALNKRVYAEPFLTPRLRPVAGPRACRHGPGNGRLRLRQGRAADEMKAPEHG